MTSLLRTSPVDPSQSGTSGYRRKTCLKITYILGVHLIVVLYTHKIEILNCVMLEPKMRCTKMT